MILALLAMFGLIAVAFVVLTGHAQRGAKSVARIGQSDSVTDSSQRTLLQQAAMQVFRGSTNIASVMGAHSLLETMYGNGFVKGYLDYPSPNPNPVCGGQVIEITSSVDLNRYVGCVLTITGNQTSSGSPDPNVSVPYYLQSTRIVGLNPTNGNPQILAFPDGASLAHVTDGGQPVYVTFSVNSVPFSGTGFGYNPNSAKLDLLFDFGATNPANMLTTTSSTTTQPVALLPNVPLSVYMNTTIAAIQNAFGNPPGGVNSDYTAADFQHMLVAAQVPGTPVQTLPSLHRPALINYWMSQKAATSFATLWTSGQQDLCRKIMLRPVGTMSRLTSSSSPPPDHPNFTGSNANFDPANYATWDVDNDGDGVPDSVWVDLGMPARATADGRLYKPLFAILCTDLDGRLNVNAHGCLAQTIATYYGNVTADGRPVATRQYCFGGIATTATLPRGQGYGPAEINLTPLFGGTPTAWQALLAGNYGTSLDGRYGEVATAGATLVAGPGTSFPRTAVVAGQDWLGWNTLFDYPDNYWTGAGIFNLVYTSLTPAAPSPIYGSPPDLKGTQAVGLDLRGQPLYQDGGTAPATSGQTVLLPDATVSASTTNPYAGGTQNTPYAINLSSSAARGQASPSSAPDNPFGVAELERILRPYDKDAIGLPSRLSTLAPSLTGQRFNATTESWDVPCPSLMLPPHLLTKVISDLQDSNVDPTVKQWIRTWVPASNMLDFFTARYYTDQRTSGPPTTTSTAVAEMGNAQSNVKVLVAANGGLLPPELFFGQKMKLNWPLANWGSAFYLIASPTNTVSATPPKNPWPGTLNTDAMGNTLTSIAARQRMARYLYVLALLLHDQNNDLTGILKLWYPNEYTSFTAAQKNYLITRRIAQWAINAVCFQTPDSVMVPFKYDTKPFTATGWGSDDDLTNPTADNRRGNDCAVVWGCKPPELLLTETMAVHDRRVADTALDDNTHKKRTDQDPGNPGHPADATLDQTRIPQGSAFFEFYCPRNATNAQAPTDLYTPAGGKWSLNLGQMAPGPSSDGATYPVWRMVIGKPARGGAADPNNDATGRFTTKPDTFVPETEQYVGATDTGDANLFPAPATDPVVKIDRIVWFAQSDPVTAATPPRDANIIYYNHTGATQLPCGRYLLVGPRKTTSLGSTGAAPTSGTDNNSLQKIYLNSTGTIGVTDLSGTADPNNDTTNKIQPPLAMIVSADPPTTVWTESQHTTNGIGISISEPLPQSSYYQEPKVTGADGIEEWYGDGISNSFLDGPQDSVAGRPLKAEGLLPTATTLNYKTVFLQRLANPLLAFDATTNPYRTVDWMPIDLTVFNGEDRAPSTGTWPPAWLTTGESWDPDDPNNAPYGTPPKNPQVVFKTRERGINTAPTNLWAQSSTDPTGSSNAYAATGTVFAPQLDHTLGYINTVAPHVSTSWLTSADNVPGTSPAEPIPAAYHGDPKTPFPWLTWNGRPFINQLELLQVPASHPGRLLWEFSMVSSSQKPYSPTGAADVSFHHLLDFFHSGNPGGSVLPGPELQRLLDFVYVPSRFVGTETQINPNFIGGSHAFHPPFNRISTYREPGRINLNTIYSVDVWNGLMNYFPDMNTASAGWQWPNFWQNRQGYTPVGANILSMNNACPTQFARPFRSSVGTMMAPTGLVPTREVDGTLLREDTSAVNHALLEYYPTAQNAYNNSDRNPFFRYQAIQRLGNLVTTRSNVYAVWITVGYFEVLPVSATTVPQTATWTPAQINAVYPDGYTLGRELGSDTGEIERHRAFYIFDRTIPVGFQRGQDMNVEKAILVKRFIE